jgi:hypothetical protein
MNSFRPLFLRIVYFRPRILKHRDLGTVKSRDDFEIGPVRTRQAPYQGTFGQGPRLPDLGKHDLGSHAACNLRRDGLGHAHLIQGYKYIRMTIQTQEIQESRSGKNRSYPGNAAFISVIWR